MIQPGHYREGEPTIGSYDNPPDCKPFFSIWKMCTCMTGRTDYGSIHRVCEGSGRLHKYSVYRTDSGNLDTSTLQNVRLGGVL